MYKKEYVVNMPKEKGGNKKKVILQDCLPQNFLVLKIDTKKDFSFYILWDVFLQKVNDITSLAIGVQKSGTSATLCPTRHLPSAPLMITDLEYMPNAYIAVMHTDTHWSAPDHDGVLHIPCIRVQEIKRGIARGTITSEDDVKRLPYQTIRIMPCVQNERPLIRVEVEPNR